MLIAWVPLLFVVVGLLMYFAPTNPRIQRLGEIVFFCAFMAAMFAFSRQTVHVL